MKTIIVLLACFALLCAFPAFANTNTFPLTGDVGIGTLSPTANLELYSTSDYLPQLFLTNVDSTGGSAPYGIFRKARSGPGNVASGDALGTFLFEGYYNSAYQQAAYFNAVVDAAPSGSTVPAAIAFANGSTETIRFSSNNRVGIGTTAPANTLDIGNSGGIHITSGVPSSTSNALYNNSGTLTWNGTAISMASISGTTDYFPYFTSSTGLGDSVLYQSGSKIGIGMTSPAATLDVDTTTANTSGTVTVLDVLAQSTGSMGNSFGPVISFSTKDIHTLNTLGAIGAVQDGASNTGDIVFYTTASSTSTEKMRILSNGYVGIGTTSPAQALEVNGQVQIDSWGIVGATTTVCESGNVLALCSSSIRYKENVKNFDRGLDDLMRMRPVKFKWKDRDENDFGLIAEEVRDIDPLYVTYHDGRIQGVKYSELTAVIINAVKEQQQEIADLKKELADLKAATGKPDTAPSKAY